MADTAEDPSPADDSVEVLEIGPDEYHELRSRFRIAGHIYLFELCKYLPPAVKNRLYRTAGVEIGAGTVIAPHAQVDPFFPEKITIGSGSVIGWGTKLLTHETYDDQWHVGPIEIGDDVTLGHTTSTRPGVTIGDGAVVAAHSFVNRDVAPGEKVGGVPIETL